MYSLTKRNGSASTYDLLENDSVLSNSIFMSGIAVELQDKARCRTSDQENMTFAKSKAILVLSTLLDKLPPNKPMTITIDGKLTKIFDFDLRSRQALEPKILNFAHKLLSSHKL